MNRRCKNPECGKEFFAAYVDQLYCCAACRIKRRCQKKREIYQEKVGESRALSPEKVAELKARLFITPLVDYPVAPQLKLAPLRPQVTQRDEEEEEHRLQGRYGKIVSVTQGAATCSGCRRLLQPGRSCRCGYQEEVGE